MATFAVFATLENALIAGALERNFPRRFHIAPGQWVVASDGTAEQVARQLGLDGAAGQFVVFSVAGYFGYHRKDLWEWLTLNSG